MAMMISKFHKIIQSKIVWTVFAALICIAFVGVYTGSKSSDTKSMDQKRSALAGRLFDEDVTREEFGHAWNGIRVMVSMYSMINPRFGMTEEQMYDAAWVRLATLKKSEQLGMKVSDEQTVAAIQAHPLFLNRQTGQYDPSTYNMFVSQFLPRLRLSPKGFEQIIRENVLIEKVSAIPAQGGVVSEEEIKKAFHLYTDMLTVEYAAIPRSLAETPEVTEEEAKNHFAANQEQFRMPEMVLVDYVQFAVTDHLDKVEATDEMVAQFYENNKQRYLKEPAEDAPEDAAPEFKPLEEVKAEITETIKMALARKTAADQADILVSELAIESTTFEKVATEMGLAIVKNTPKFSQTDAVKGIDPTAPFTRAAFALESDETHYYSDPVVGRDFIYVISLAKKYDSFLPSFDVVRDAATESAKIAAAETAYIEKAEQVHREIQTVLKAGTAFADAAAKQKLELNTTVPFNLTTTLEDEFGREIKQGAVLLGQGKLTDLIPTLDEYLVAFVAKKVPGDEATELPGMREELVNGIENEKSARLVAAWREGLLDEAGFEDLLPRAGDES